MTVKNIMVKQTQMPFTMRYRTMTVKNSTSQLEREKLKEHPGRRAGGKVASVNEQQKKTTILIGDSE